MTMCFISFALNLPFFVCITVGTTVGFDGVHHLYVLHEMLWIFAWDALPVCELFRELLAAV